MALGANGHFAVVGDRNASLLAPDKRPPRTRWSRTPDGVFLGEGGGVTVLCVEWCPVPGGFRVG